MASRTRTRRRRPDIARLRRRAIVGVAALAITIGLALLDRSGKLAAPPDPSARATVYEGARALVTRVVDGDTLVVALPDRQAGSAETKIRLWGVDAPELARGGSPDEPYAREARALVEGLAAGKIVVLDVEDERLRDRYERVLAHVLVPTARGEESVGELLLEAGLGRHEARWANTRTRALAAAERRAKEAGRGLWARGPAR